jgi:hypothetical protein
MTIAHRLFVLVALGFFSASLPAAGPDRLERAETLIQRGAYDAALKLLEQAMPSSSDLEAWTAWERKRVRLLRAQESLDALVQGRRRWPANLPLDFQRWWLGQAAQTALAAGRPEAARAMLRELLWQGDEASLDEYSHWRRLVIKSYLLENRVDDAHVALVRYQQDHPLRHEPWQVLLAETLLRLGSPDAAHEALTSTQSPEAKRLKLLSALRAGTQTPASVFSGMAALRTGTAEYGMDSRALAQATLEATEKLNDVEKETLAFEWALNFPAAGRPAAPGSAERLWKNYERLAERVASRERLLVGSDPDWLTSAKKLSVSQPVLARALYAHLAAHGTTDGVARQAHENLAATLLKEGALYTAYALYVEVPVRTLDADAALAVRGALIDRALEQYQTALAISVLDATAVSSLPAALPWQLRNARLALLQGNARLAEQRLLTAVENAPTLDDESTMCVLDLLAEFEALGASAPLLALLEVVETKVKNPTYLREIYFREGRELSRVRDHAGAAERYLQSANYQGIANDAFGINARTQAAESLVAAGRLADARTVYQSLLLETRDPGNRATIEKRLQQLWPVQATPNAP